MKLQDLLREKADKILEGVDYDMFKEDEGGQITQGIINVLESLVSELPLSFEYSTVISLKSESGDNYLFTSHAESKEDVLEELKGECYVEESLYIESFLSNVEGLNVMIVSRALSEMSEGE